MLKTRIQKVYFGFSLNSCQIPWNKALQVLAGRILYLQTQFHVDHYQLHQSKIWALGDFNNTDYDYESMFQEKANMVKMVHRIIQDRGTKYDSNKTREKDVLDVLLHETNSITGKFTIDLISDNMISRRRLCTNAYDTSCSIPYRLPTCTTTITGRKHEAQEVQGREERASNLE
ncbi:hypothetical protein KI387_043261 [Taxus chinensis]|uniref:Uncharacterized protein n=1 Tax=Taxus chinensis TaxID=29808 RepID=A0AA38F6P2_TAXCH|nr:hypothetical protein KI387_043261 [Taxus chinensis]